MTRSGVVVDASVVVEYLVELRWASQATSLFRTLVTEPSFELWAPDLVYVEAASALRRLVRGRIISRHAGHGCVAKLAALPLTISKMQPLVVGAYAAAEAMTIYDATYAVLAQRTECPLVTADAKLVRALRARKHDVRLLSELP